MEVECETFFGEAFTALNCGLYQLGVSTVQSTGELRPILQLLPVRYVKAQEQKPDLVFHRNGRVHLNRRGCQFSRLLAVRSADQQAAIVLSLAITLITA